MHTYMYLMFAIQLLLISVLSFLLYLTVVIEKGEFDYVQPSAECYRRQMLKSVEKFGDGQFDHNNHTHVCFGKVHFVNIAGLLL